MRKLYGKTPTALWGYKPKPQKIPSTRLWHSLREGQDCGEVDLTIDVCEAATFLQMTMQGIQLGARAGGEAKSLRAQARFAINRLRSR